MRLSPLSPKLWIPMNDMAGCLALMKRYEEAVEWAQRSIRAFDARLAGPTSDATPGDLKSPNYWTYAHLASALGHLGRTGEAKAALDEMLQRNPDFSRELVMRLIQPPNPNERDDWFEGLRKAGWRE